MKKFAVSTIACILLAGCGANPTLPAATSESSSMTAASIGTATAKELVQKAVQKELDAHGYSHPESEFEGIIIPAGEKVYSNLKLESVDLAKGGRAATFKGSAVSVVRGAFIVTGKKFEYTYDCTVDGVYDVHSKKFGMFRCVETLKK